MLLCTVKSLLSPLRSFPSCRFSTDSDPDFQKQVKTSVTSHNIKDVIDKMVQSNDVLVFMKGTPERPQCGYSNTVVSILK